MFVLSNFVGAEVTSMGTGLLSILLSVVYVKVVGVKTPEEYRYRFTSQEKKYGPFRAMSPYIYMLVLLPAVRYGFPALVKNGFDGYVRPDHGRNVWGENAKPGYGLFDRAMGACYLSGLFEAVEKDLKENK